MAAFAFANCKNTLGTVNWDFQVFELFSVDCFEFQVKLVRSSALWESLKLSSLKIDWDTLELIGRKFSHANRAKVTIIHEMMEAWVFGQLNSVWEAVDLDRGWVKISCVSLNLIL